MGSSASTNYQAYYTKANTSRDFVNEQDRKEGFLTERKKCNADLLEHGEISQ